MVSRLLCKAFITLDELITPLHPKNNGLSTVFSNTHFITMRKHCVLQFFVKNGKYFKASDSILSKHTNTMSDNWCKHVIYFLFGVHFIKCILWLFPAKYITAYLSILSKWLYICNTNRYLYLFRRWRSCKILFKTKYVTQIDQLPLMNLFICCFAFSASSNALVNKQNILRF